MEGLMNAVLGGMLVGLGAVVFYLSIGKIAGISGIFFGMFRKGAEPWRAVFFAGLALGSWTIAFYLPEVASVSRPYPGLLALIASGFIVGLGTRLANGCTSGHGVCGLGRLSIRSLAAVSTFMASGVLAASFLRHWGGLI